MPYIQPNQRLKLDGVVHQLKRPSGLFAGEMNYLITRLLLAWLGPDPGYEQYNSVLGILEAVKLEFYTRKIRGYEDMKMAENGDAYTGYS